MADVQEVLGADGLAVALARMAEEIAGQFGDAPHLALVGIKQRGDLLATRLSALLAARIQRALPVGSLDITLYRDDFESLTEQPVVGDTDIDFAIAGCTVILVDDVLFTGRTVRAALDELADLGRPARVVLAVLVDREGRELPITADVVGVRLAVEPGGQVQVMLRELDGQDAVILHRPAPSGNPQPPQSAAPASPEIPKRSPHEAGA